MHPSPAAPLLNHQVPSSQFAFTFPEVLFSKAVTIPWLFKFFRKWVLLHSNGIGALQKLSVPTAHFEPGRSPILQKSFIPS